MNMHRVDTGPAISLIRTTPPTPTWIKDELGHALASMADASDLETVLRYHRFRGTDEDRERGAQWLSNRLIEPPTPERVVVTNGTQNALFLALSTIFGDGGVLATENLSYYGFRRLAAMLSIPVEPITMDADGAIPDAFEEVCRKERVKALFLTPTIHNPTTGIMPEQRRRDLASVARKYGVSIIEDDVYGLLPPQSPPPFASIAPDITWYATGLAKCVSPGLRTGYLVPPDDNADHRLSNRFQVTTTWQVAPLSAMLANRWIENGVAKRILDAVRQEAQARQNLAAELLANGSFRANENGLHIWLDLPGDLTESSFIDAALQKGVILRPGSMFSVVGERAPRCIRVVLGSPETRDELVSALGRLSDIIGAAA
ncbi:PLP-dependent aminotransferase family protein [Sinorhizobium meliloti]|uniref:aminotransferase-like domain-containing protein n=1 Tax=Rhizobium meliloti TaxID=382 RepID=UPI0002E00D7F|nr:PLP-dependent aminotransferase family protein [Sinorhizobium meliloti]MDE3878754.1 PLP-dependent aminotransferase family protein [Sinorhizobium meliloti]MDE4604562.1 PLP-dependent aminotransferase family protein [Sinorhizobium meliloti]MDX0315171.1 aminotransferase class I/II-fold pyridoxal phosphate-dependent enzyme [Sinorhizobium meliloti]UDU21123.1 PLP-dependent aminotransferase family protein [Sinorhizobium meliloti]